MIITRAADIRVKILLAVLREENLTIPALAERFDISLPTFYNYSSFLIIHKMIKLDYSKPLIPGGIVRSLRTLELTESVKIALQGRMIPADDDFQVVNDLVNKISGIVVKIKKPKRIEEESVRSPEPTHKIEIKMLQFLQHGALIDYQLQNKVSLSDKEFELHIINLTKTNKIKVLPVEGTKLKIIAKVSAQVIIEQKQSYHLRRKFARLNLASIDK